MMVGAAASFATLAFSPSGLGALLGAAFGISAILSLSLWFVMGLALARAIRRDSQWRALNIGLGVLLALSVFPIWL